MLSIYNVLVFTHLLGLALGVGCATVKLVLLIRCNSDYGFFYSYFNVAKLITRILVIGIILLTLSGIGWLLNGFPFTTLLIVKVVFVGLIWVLGPIIDNVVEPKLEKSIPIKGETFGPEFIRIRKQHFALEIAATVFMYATMIMGVLL